MTLTAPHRWGSSAESAASELPRGRSRRRRSAQKHRTRTGRTTTHGRWRCRTQIRWRGAARRRRCHCQSLVAPRGSAAFQLQCAGLVLEDPVFKLFNTTGTFTKSDFTKSGTRRQDFNERLLFTLADSTHSTSRSVPWSLKSTPPNEVERSKVSKILVTLRAFVRGVPWESLWPSPWTYRVAKGTGLNVLAKNRRNWHSISSIQFPRRASEAPDGGAPALTSASNCPFYPHAKGPVPARAPRPVRRRLRPSPPPGVVREACSAQAAVRARAGC